VAEFFDRAVRITEAINAQTGGKMKDFKTALQDGPAAFPDLVKLGDDVRTFARGFPTVGF
jgi:hypothetical protein